MRIALSAGGFRATLFHLGVIRYLRESGKLKELTAVYSVSGGSIIAAHLLLQWSKYTADDEKLFQEAVDELIRFCRSDVRGRIIRRWLLATVFAANAMLLILWIILGDYNAPLVMRMLAAGGILVTCGFVLASWGPCRFIALLKREYGSLYSHATNQALWSPKTPDFAILATNLTTGSMTAFNKSGVMLDVTVDASQIKHKGIPLAIPGERKNPVFYVFG